MNLKKDFLLLENALLINNSLVINDLQIGREEEASEGDFFSTSELDFIKEKLLFFIKNYDFKRLIINGDIKQEFTRFNKQEFFDIGEFFLFLKKEFFNKEIVIIKGNHDSMLESFIKKKGLMEKNFFLKDYYFNNGFLFFHGHKIYNDKEFIMLFNKAHTIILGHEHPAIRLYDGIRFEYFKAFLVGESSIFLEERPLNKEVLKNNKKKRLNINFVIKKNNNLRRIFVVPSFSKVTIGSDILKENFLSPLLIFLKEKNIIKDFAVYVLHNEPFYFGSLKDVQAATSFPGSDL